MQAVRSKEADSSSEREEKGAEKGLEWEWVDTMLLWMIERDSEIVWSQRSHVGPWDESAV